MGETKARDLTARVGIPLNWDDTILLTFSDGVTLEISGPGHFSLGVVQYDIAPFMRHTWSAWFGRLFGGCEICGAPKPDYLVERRSMICEKCFGEVHRSCSRGNYQHSPNKVVKSYQFTDYGDFTIRRGPPG